MDYSKSTQMNLQDVFDKSWKNYGKLNPSVQRIHDLFTRKGKKLENDHIAFRTFNDPRINIDILSKIFLQLGYIEKTEYQFKAKKLLAKHFKIPGCYYKSVKRYPDQASNLHGGFIEKLADRIFESTDFYKKKKD